MEERFLTIQMGILLAVFWRDNDMFHVAITAIRRRKGTSEYWNNEEEGGKICLTPKKV